MYGDSKEEGGMLGAALGSIVRVTEYQHPHGNQKCWLVYRSTETGVQWLFIDGNGDHWWRDERSHSTLMKQRRAKGIYDQLRRNGVTGVGYGVM